LLSLLIILLYRNHIQSVNTDTTHWYKATYEKYASQFCIDSSPVLSLFVTFVYEKQKCVIYIQYVYMRVLRETDLVCNIITFVILLILL